MRRLSTILLAMTWLGATMLHSLAGRTPAIPAPATLRSITVTDPSAGKEVLLRIDGGYSFKTVHTPQGQLYVDLQGVAAGSISPSAQWPSGILAGYQLLQCTGARGESILRVEIQTRTPELLIAVQESSGLRLLLSESSAGSSAPTPPADAVGFSPAGQSSAGSSAPRLAARCCQFLCIEPGHACLQCCHARGQGCRFLSWQDARRAGAGFGYLDNPRVCRRSHH